MNPSRQELLDVLLGTSDPHRAKEAGEKMNNLLSSFEGVQIMVGLLCESNVSDLCLHSGYTLLRRFLFEHWSKFSVQDQRAFRSALLSRLSDDRISKLTQTSASHLLSSIYHNSAPNDQDDLYEAVVSGVKHNSLYLCTLSSIVSTPGADLENKVDNLICLLSTYTTQANPSSAIYVCHCLQGIVLWLAAEDRVKHRGLRPLLQDFLRMFKQCAENLEFLPVGLEVLVDIAECLDVFTSDDIEEMADMMFSLATQQNVEIRIRRIGLLFLYWIARRKSKTVLRLNLLDKYVDTLISIALEPSDLDDPDSPLLVASQSLDALCVYLPSKRVFDVTMKKIPDMLKSLDIHKKGVALCLLGIMSEGCSLMMRQNLKMLIQVVSQCLVESNVIGSAVQLNEEQIEHLCRGLLCLSNFCEYLQPEVLSYSSQLVEFAEKTIAMPYNKVQRHSCWLLDILFSSMDANLFNNETTHRLIKHMIQILVSPGSSSSAADDGPIKTKKACFAALSHCAKALGANFGVYAQVLIPNIVVWLESPSSGGDGDNLEFIELTGKCVELLGHMLSNVPSSQEEFETITSKVLQGMASPSNCVREASCTFFAALVESDRHEIKQKTEAQGSSILHNVFIVAANSLLDEEESLKGDEPYQQVSGVTSEMVNELDASAALIETCYENWALHTMAPFLQKTLELIQLLAQHYLPTARQHACVMSRSLMYHLGNIYLLGDLTPQVDSAGVAASAGKSKIPESISNVWREAIIVILLEILGQDEDKDCISEVCNCLGDIYERFGASLISREVDHIASYLDKLFLHSHACQVNQEDIDDSSRQEDEYLFDSISRLMCGISTAMGKDFLPLYRQMHPKLFALSNHKSTQYACIGLGCMAEIFKSLGSNSCEFVAGFLPTATRALVQNEDLELKRNAAFAIGVVFEACPESEELYRDNEYNKIFPAMQSLCSLRENAYVSMNLVIDNAIAALCRIYLGLEKSGNAEILDGYQLFSCVLEGLPLIEDFVEYEVISKFFGLYLMKKSYLLSMAKDFKVITNVLHNVAIMCTSEQHKLSHEQQVEMETLACTMLSIEGISSLSSGDYTERVLQVSGNKPASEWLLKASEHSKNLRQQQPVSV